MLDEANRKRPPFSEHDDIRRDRQPNVWKLTLQISSNIAR
jgi:hypothetical protein